MKKILLSICLLSAYAVSLSQPVSFGGITPGTTTREELKNLVKEPNKIGTGNYGFFLDLKQPDGKRISVKFYNDVIYELEVSVDSTLTPDELKPALIAKYGQPRIKVGNIRAVTCKNKLGASLERLHGDEEYRWQVKDGVQGAIRRWAVDCAEFAYQSYVLRHVATVQIEERAANQKAHNDAAEKRRKLGDAY